MENQNESNELSIRGISSKDEFTRRIVEQKGLMDREYKRCQNELLLTPSAVQNKDYIYTFMSEVISTFSMIESEVQTDNADFSSLETLKQFSLDPFLIKKIPNNNQDYELIYKQFVVYYFLINKFLSKAGITNIGVPNIKWVDAT